MKFKFDTEAIINFDVDMRYKYANREDKDNIYGVGLTDSEFRNYIIKILLGNDWYVVDPISHNQVNEEAMYAILDKLNKNWRKL